MYTTSTYRKIVQVLDAASEHSGSIGTLADYIEKHIAEYYDAFVYYRREKNGDVEPYTVSTSAIRRQIRFCVALKFLKSDEECTLTTNGKLALEEGRFDLVLRQAILSFLDADGVPWSKLEKAIDSAKFPEAGELYKRVKPKNISASKFRTCLYLLSQCGSDSNDNILHIYVRRLYLTHPKSADDD